MDTYSLAFAIWKMTMNMRTTTKTAKNPDIAI
jgi:hypothetical protein